PPHRRHDAQREARRGRIRLLHVPAPLRGDGRRRRPPRLDRAPRQPRRVRRPGDARTDAPGRNRRLGALLHPCARSLPGAVAARAGVVIASTPADEGRHEPGPGAYWNESWYFDFSRADGTGGYVRLGLYPNQQTAWYWAYLVSPEHGLV